MDRVGKARHGIVWSCGKHALSSGWFSLEHPYNEFIVVSLETS